MYLTLDQTRQDQTTSDQTGPVPTHHTRLDQTRLGQIPQITQICIPLYFEPSWDLAQLDGKVLGGQAQYTDPRDVGVLAVELAGQPGSKERGQVCQSLVLFMSGSAAELPAWPSPALDGLQSLSPLLTQVHGLQIFL